jgi:cytochrome c oxidase assembly factor CtaG
MRRLIPISLLLSATPLFAHTDIEVVTPDELWHAWSFEPFVLVLLTLSAALYWIGLRKSRGSAASRGKVIAFALGWFTLLVSQVSPLHRLGSALFSVHMAQHELLMLIAAPLLVYSRPLATFLWALPPSCRVGLGEAAKNRRFARIWTFVTLPLVAWSVHAAALWMWHIPSLYQATLESEWVHALQHTSFLGSALLFWWALMHEQRVRNYGASVAYIFTTAVHSGALGGLLTFAQTLWYPIYSGRTVAWALSPLEDQQLGGLLMWIPSGVVFLAIGLWLFARWLQESERRVQLSTAATISRD